MAVLHPVECYLLELYSSAEHIAATRDAIINWVDAHEAAFNRYQHALPVRGRAEPLWKQGDVVWGTRVLPNIRPCKERYIKAYILRTQNDPAAFNTGHTISGCRRGIVEFWDGWMTDEESQRIDQAEREAAYLDQMLTSTVEGNWYEGDLSYLGPGGLYKLTDLPRRIPRYVLDPSVRIEKHELPQQTGIYLPDIDYAPARFLYPGAVRAAGIGTKASQVIRRCEWVDPDTGERDYSWDETIGVETGWTLIRRVEGEYIEVPAEGFFPTANPEELYTWPQREKDYISREGCSISAWSGEPSAYDGEWSVFYRGGLERVSLQQGQRLPYMANFP